MLAYTLSNQLATRKLLIIYPDLGKDSNSLCISLTPLDIEVMKRLGSRVNLIPVIAKADTLTPINLDKFKQNVSCIMPYES
jgi:hypothetical protein